MATHPLRQVMGNSTRSVALGFLVIVPLALIGCPSGTNVDRKIITSPDASSSPKSTSDFDGERAFEHVRKQVEFGPRPPGSPELEKTRGYVIDQLKSYGLKVMTDE